MSKSIRTYADLLEEKQQLEVLLKAQQELLRYDIEQLKTEIRPAITTFGMLGKMFTKDKSNAFLNTGVDTVVDFVFKRLLLGKAGWLPRLVLPFFMKNVTSHIVAEKKDTVIQKLVTLFKKRRNHNGKTHPDPEPGSMRKGANNTDDNTTNPTT